VPDAGYASISQAWGTPRVSFYQRLEPRCRDDDFSRGLEARWAGAKWGLARQWQVGEFQGEDTGSPIRVCLTTKTNRINTLDFGTETPSRSLIDEQSEEPYPLEPLVEHDHIHPKEIMANWRMRVQIGQQFERFLFADDSLSDRAIFIICELRKLYPIKLPTDTERKSIDRATQRFLSVMVGRVIDGGRLLQSVGIPVVDTWKLPASVRNQFGVDIDVDDIDESLGELKKWFEALYGKISDSEPSAWIQDSLEYQFRVHAPSGDENITLSAPSYQNGELDWYTCDLESFPDEVKDSTIDTEDFVPSRVSFHGMPHPRWWAFEDSYTDFGNVDTVKTNLAQMMIMNFGMMIYGNDWFMIPLPVKIGTITRIETLTVTDVFGVETNVPRAQSVSDDPLQAWQMYSLSRTDNPDEVGDFLFLPPTVGFAEESPPLEEVRFMRDEMANMVWAMEHTIQNGLGQPFGGFEAQTEKLARRRETELRERLEQLQQQKAQLLQQLGDQASVHIEDTMQTLESLQTKVDDLEQQIIELQSRMVAAGLTSQPEISTDEEPDLPRYRLATTVPANWIPFIPVRLSEMSPEIALRQAEMIRNVEREDATPESIDPMTRLLAGVNGMGALERLREESVTRAGQKYQLTRQRVRWLDGKTFIWIGRKVAAGKGEGSSGLKFDVMKETS
jgi:hypothetical protein